MAKEITFGGAAFPAGTPVVNMVEKWRWPQAGTPLASLAFLRDCLDSKEFMENWGAVVQRWAHAKLNFTTEVVRLGDVFFADLVENKDEEKAMRTLETISKVLPFTYKKETILGKPTHTLTLAVKPGRDITVARPA